MAGQQETMNLIIKSWHGANMEWVQRLLDVSGPGSPRMPVRNSEIQLFPGFCTFCPRIMTLQSRYIRFGDRFRLHHNIKQLK